VAYHIFVELEGTEEGEKRSGMLSADCNTNTNKFGERIIEGMKMNQVLMLQSIYIYIYFANYYISCLLD
jgi:hypothetical protein